MKLSPIARFQANVEAWFDEMGWFDCPIFDNALFPLQPDRCFVEWSLGLQGRFTSQMDRWTLKIAAHQPLGCVTAVQGWRERRARWAAQVVEHYHPSHGRFFEVDFDASNPNWGVALAISHGLFDWFWQKVRGHRTDPFTVARKRGLDTPSKRIDA